jgi:hypothetical protein
LFPAWAEATTVTVKSKRLNFMALISRLYHP